MKDLIGYSLLIALFYFTIEQYHCSRKNRRDRGVIIKKEKPTTVPHAVLWKKPPVVLSTKRKL
jgi:hypothetical protein